VDLLKARGMNDVLVVVGGIIPDIDIPALNALGIEGIFQPGTPMQAIIDFIEEHVRDVPVTSHEHVPYGR
jgi:methylmalonyl-CoA mutase C-terminal domain/subunit